MDLQKLYTRRFSSDQNFRQAMWKILCHDFFQQYVPRTGTVLEVGAGYCEFINSVVAERRIALDINPDTSRYAAQGVNVVQGSSTQMKMVSDDSVDLVFASNFFEHLIRDDILATFREVYRVLKPGGKFMVLQPNIRFCGSNYWMFFDHITPIDDRAFVEALEINGFRPLRVIERFLPYTTQSRLPRALSLIRIYLRFPFAWRFFGGQSFILSLKP